MYICTPDSIDLCILYFTVGLWIRTRSDLIYSILPDPDVFRSYPSKMFINQLLDVPNNCFLFSFQNYVSHCSPEKRKDFETFALRDLSRQ